MRRTATSRSVPNAIAVTRPAVIQRTHAQFKYLFQGHRSCRATASAQETTAGSILGGGGDSLERRNLPNSRWLSRSSWGFIELQFLRDESSRQSSSEAKMRGVNSTKNSQSNSD